MKTQLSRWLRLAIVSAANVALLACGGASGTGGTSTTVNRSIGNPTQNVTGFVSDATADNIAALKLDVTDVKVADGNGHLTVLASGPQNLEFAHLSLAPTTSFSTPIDTGDYKALTLTLGNPQLNVTDSTGKVTIVSPATSPSVSLKTSAVTIPLTLSVVSLKNSGIIIDFDIQKSVTQDGNGNYIIDPKFTVTGTSDTSSTSEVVDSVAKITALAQSPLSIDAIISDTGQSIHVIVGSDAIFDSVLQKFGNLQVGQMVSITAKYQSSTNQYAAKFISSVAPDAKLASYGVVSGRTTQANGGAKLAVVVQR